MFFSLSYSDFNLYFSAILDIELFYIKTLKNMFCTITIVQINFVVQMHWILHFLLYKVIPELLIIAEGFLIFLGIFENKSYSQFVYSEVL